MQQVSGHGRRQALGHKRTPAMQELMRSACMCAAEAAGQQHGVCSQSTKFISTPEVSHESAQPVQEAHQVEPVVLGKGSSAGLCGGQRLLQARLAAAAWVQAGHLHAHRSITRGDLYAQ